MTEVRDLVPQLLGDARAFWPEVRAELEAIRARCAEPWLVEDVWAEMVAGNAYLWTVGEPGDLDGFCIFQVHATPYSRALHIWACAERTIANAADYWPQILHIAEEAKCSTVTIESPRRWERALPGADVRYLYSFKVE